MTASAATEQAFPYSTADYQPVACNLCGSKDHKLIESRDRNALNVQSVICTHCGLIYLSPRMTPAWYGRYYEVEYRPQMSRYKRQRSGRDATPASQKSFDKMFAAQRQRGAWLVDYLRQHNIPAPRRILDVGSSSGGLLHALREAFGSEVLGAEPSPDEAAYAEAQGVPTVVGMFEDFSLTDVGQFDLILCTQSFNHLLDPHGVAVKIRECLTDRGAFFLECQDFFHVCQKRACIREAVQIDHVYMFVPATLRGMLEATGFELLPDSLVCDRWQSPDKLDQQRKLGVPSLHVRMLARRARVATQPTSRFEDVFAELQTLPNSPLRAEVTR